MNTNPTYNYHQPPPADYVDPEGRVRSDGITDVFVMGRDGFGYTLSTGYVRDNWEVYEWWSPVPPTPPVPPKPRRYRVSQRPDSRIGMQFWIVDAHNNGVTVAEMIKTIEDAQFIADALERRDV